MIWRTPPNNSAMGAGLWPRMKSATFRLQTRSHNQWKATAGKELLSIIWWPRHTIYRHPLRRKQQLCHTVTSADNRRCDILRNIASRKDRHFLRHCGYCLLQCWIRPPLWTSGQSFWLQIQRFRVRFSALPDFLRSRGSGTGSTQPREDNWGATWMKK
jgi:hypothetical protein